MKNMLYSLLKTIVLSSEYDNRAVKMLDILTKSTIRKKILLLFFYNQNKEFYLREIAKLVSTSPGTAKRELDRLMKQDLLIFSKKANISIYKLNSKNPLIPHLEGIISATIGLEITLKNALAGQKGIKFAFIFGSYAKNKFKSDSDIDLYVIGSIDGKKMHEIVKIAEDLTHRQINYHLESETEFKTNLKKDFFRQEIIKKHIILTDNEDEFGKIIK